LVLGPILLLARLTDAVADIAWMGHRRILRQFG
jgi:hypothetical protein